MPMPGRSDAAEQATAQGTALASDSQPGTAPEAAPGTAPESAVQERDPGELRRQNRVLAIRLVAVAALVLATAVGVAVLVLQFEATHAIPKP